MVVSVDDFKSFLGFFTGIFDDCYVFLSSINIAGLTLFEWILGFMAAGSIFVIIRAFAHVGGVSVSGVASGAAEQIKSAQRTAERNARYRERKGGK